MGFCEGTKEIWGVVGTILFWFKILIPILLIIWGALDFGKAVIAAKDDEIKKASKSLAMRFISGVIVFLVPTIISFGFTIVGEFNEIKDDFNICKTCLTSPSKCTNTGTNTVN